MKKIIINADDYGLNPFFNKGIIQCIKEGLISSVSVMIEKDFADSNELSAFKHVSVGLHLEIKEKEEQEKEIVSQIEKFEKLFGAKPSHLDGHQHCHLLPENIEIVAKIAKKYNIPVRSKSEADRKYLRLKKIKTPDAFISWHPNKYIALIDQLTDVDLPIIEMVCHPGYYDNKSDILYNESREKELNFLKSSTFNKVIKDFKLVSYNDI